MLIQLFGWAWSGQTDKFFVAQAWKSKFHVSIFTWLMLSAVLLVMLTCCWEPAGFGIFTLGVSSCCVPRCRSADSVEWSAWASVAPVFSCVPSKNCYAVVGIFAKGVFQPILQVQSGNTFQQEEGITAHSLCVRWRGSAMVVARIPSHSLWTGPGSSQLCSSSFPEKIEGVRKPSTDVHGLEGKKECCSR